MVHGGRAELLIAEKRRRPHDGGDCDNASAALAPTGRDAGGVPRQGFDVGNDLAAAQRPGLDQQVDQRPNAAFVDRHLCPEGW